MRSHEELAEAQQFWNNVQDTLGDIAAEADEHLPTGARPAASVLSEALAWANANAGRVAYEIRRADQEPAVTPTRGNYEDSFKAAGALGVTQLRRMGVRELAARIGCGRTLASMVRNDLLNAHMALNQEAS